MHQSKVMAVGYIAVVMVLYLCTFLNSAQAAVLSESEQMWIDEHASEVSFSPVKDHPPFLWSQYGVLFGISYDYLNYIQEQLSVNFPKREPRTRKEIIDALKAGEISFTASLSQTPERTEYLLFTRPYISIPTVYVGKSGSKVKTGLEIVEKQLRVSVGDEYGVHEYLSSRYPDMQLVPADNNYLVLQNVLSGVTEIGVMNIASLSYLVREHNMTNLKKIANTGFEANSSFAVANTAPELRNIIDNVIESMPRKTRDAIVSRWITDIATIENLAGTAVVDIPETTSDKKDIYLMGMGALLLLCLGFFLHYVFVRSTPRVDETGNTEYIP